MRPEVAGGTERVRYLRHGAECLPGRGVRFRLWAPAHDRIGLLLGKDGRCLPMKSISGGWHELDVPDAGAGSPYLFQLPDGTKVPDPASRFQPEDVHGPSEVIDPSEYRWTDQAWAGRPWHEAVVYELHVGAFTAAGTFIAAIERLDHLVELGVTALEIMPVADFPGGRNWGYDGVLPYAPDSSYGRPEEFKALIEAAHARGLMVLLDVVYNHSGPDGNFLPAYAPQFFTERHKTPWGAAINYDGEDSRPVREFVIQNALYWIHEFNLDGLRFDAVHAIMDDSPEHLLDELARRVRLAASRPVHLILENEENQSSRLIRNEAGVPLTYTAQWNDDVHHVLHVAATREDKGYYADYLGDTAISGHLDGSFRRYGFIATHAVAVRAVESAGGFSFGFSDAANMRGSYALGAGAPCLATRSGRVAIQLSIPVSAVLAIGVAAKSVLIPHWVLGDADPANALAAATPVAAGSLPAVPGRRAICSRRRFERDARRKGGFACECRASTGCRATKPTHLRRAAKCNFPPLPGRAAKQTAACRPPASLSPYRSIDIQHAPAPRGKPSVSQVPEPPTPVVCRSRLSA
jgi:hypothetical protein